MIFNVASLLMIASVLATPIPGTEEWNQQQQATEQKDWAKEGKIWNDQCQTWQSRDGYLLNKETQQWEKKDCGSVAPVTEQKPEEKKEEVKTEEKKEEAKVEEKKESAPVSNNETNNQDSQQQQQQQSNGVVAPGSGISARPTFYYRVGDLPSGCVPVQSVFNEFRGAHAACGQTMETVGRYGVAIANGGAHCGKQILASHGGRSVTLTVVDSCPACESDNHLDMSVDALHELFGGDNTLTCAINTVTPNIDWRFI